MDMSLPVLDEMSGVGAEQWIKHDFTIDKRYHLIPQAKLLITIPLSNDRLVLRRIDLKVEVGKADEPKQESQPAEAKNDKRSENGKKESEKAEKAARNKLALAKILLKRNRAAAKRNLQVIVDEYSGTQAAKEARILLRKLK